MTMVVTDTCATMRKAWDIVQDEFPWMCVLPCQPHTISLLMKDIASIPNVKKLTALESTVVGWFANHHKPLAILRNKSQELLGRVYQLVKSGAPPGWVPTRW